jgi:two-component system chemotaxis sensor kinase CheA
VASAHPGLDVRAIEEASDTIERQLRELRASVMRARLVPIREIFGRMPFVVRDLARDNQKQVKLDLRGQDTEIDKFVIERLMDPILHLVRNAISHGIELPAERVVLPGFGHVVQRHPDFNGVLADFVERAGAG